MMDPDWFKAVNPPVSHKLSPNNQLLLYLHSNSLKNGWCSRKLFRFVYWGISQSEGTDILCSGVHRLFKGQGRKDKRGQITPILSTVDGTFACDFQQMGYKGWQQPVRVLFLWRENLVEFDVKIKLNTGQLNTWKRCVLKKSLPSQKKII